MKNLRIKVKITLGFAVVIVLLIVSTVATAISSTTTLQNVKYIKTGSSLQEMGNQLINAFYSARLNVKTLTLEINDEAYAEAIRYLDMCDSIIMMMEEHIDANSNLERFREDVRAARDYSALYHRNTNDVQASNTKLGEIEDELSALGKALTSLSDELDTTIIMQMRNASNESVRESAVEDLLYSASISNGIWNMRNNVSEMSKYGPYYDKYGDNVQYIDDIISIINDYRGSSEYFAELCGLMADYKSAVLSFRNEMLYNNNLVNSFTADGQAMLACVGGLINSIEIAMESRIDTTITTASGYLILILAVAGISVITSIVLAFIIGNSITRPIINLKNVMNEVAAGNLDVVANSNNPNEIGELTRAVRKVIDTILTLISKMDRMSKDFSAGDIDVRIDASVFDGSYRTVANGVNQMVEALMNDIMLYLNCVSGCSEGDFNLELPALPGKKALMNESYNMLRGNLTSISAEINSLVENAIIGHLSSRAGAQAYKGGWADILNSLNQLMETISAPISEAAETLAHVSSGDFGYMMEGSYQGEFLTIKNSINNTVRNIASYINEISETLDGLAADDLNQSITREYVGDFSSIKNSLNNIINKFNAIISNIRTAAEQVAAGAGQISESSMALAQGATQQASSIEQLNATIIAINERTMQNAQSAKEAVDISSESTNNAQIGSRDMQRMLESMNKIDESSQNIAKIIKAINDITFQTNLLALNASIEAAHAGVYGAGFAVVAEEVRSLAGKSQEASGEITESIGESMERVNEGSKTAEATAGALNRIVGDVSDVADIVKTIADASNQQVEAIGQVTLGISQITEVVQSNSATSQEAAAAAQELSSQAETLHSMVSVFKLKNAG